MLIHVDPIEDKIDNLVHQFEFDVDRIIKATKRIFKRNNALEVIDVFEQKHNFFKTLKIHYELMKDVEPLNQYGTQEATDILIETGKQYFNHLCEWFERNMVKTNFEHTPMIPSSYSKDKCYGSFVYDWSPQEEKDTVEGIGALKLIPELPERYARLIKVNQ